jgi:integrase
MRPRGTGSVYQQKGRSTWWVKYYRNGKPIRESAHTDKVRVAEKLLQSRLNEVSAGTLIELKDRRATIDELYAALLAEYRDNCRASIVGAEQRWTSRLVKHFGGMRAVNLTTAALNRYVDWCREQDLSPATINRDLAALRRAFRLGQKAKTIRDVPYFPHLREADPRKGFVEEQRFRKLIENTSELWLRALVTTAYTFGFRRSELLSMRCEQINLLDRTITLHVGTTKSDEGREIKMTENVFVLLGVCVSGKTGDDYVFTRPDGARVHDFRKSWRALCKAAEVPKLLFHDLRRSAVRNMVRRGIPERVAMQISGHKTRAVFERYNIVSEGDIAEAAKKIEAGQVGQHTGSIDGKGLSEILTVPSVLGSTTLSN